MKCARDLAGEVVKVADLVAEGVVVEEDRMV